MKSVFALLAAMALFTTSCSKDEVIEESLLTTLKKEAKRAGVASNASQRVADKRNRPSYI